MSERNDIEQLFKQQYAHMCRLAGMLLHDQEAARDVASDVFADLAEGRLAMQKAQQAGYLMVAVRNRCLNRLSHIKVADRVHELLRIDTTADITPIEHDADRQAQLLQYINTALTPQTARILRMYYRQKCTYKEIASELGISETAVYKHLSQGITKLKERFNP